MNDFQTAVMAPSTTDAASVSFRMDVPRQERAATGTVYPASLFGFSPSEEEYWDEPNLPWVAMLLNPQHYGIDPDAAAREIAELYYFQVYNESMAPRFPQGTALTARQLERDQLLTPGMLLVWQGLSTATGCCLARLVHQENGVLYLSHDNGMNIITLPRWSNDVVLFQVVHYVSKPLLFRSKAMALVVAEA